MWAVAGVRLHLSPLARLRQLLCVFLVSSWGGQEGRDRRQVKDMRIRRSQVLAMLIFLPLLASARRESLPCDRLAALSIVERLPLKSSVKKLSGSSCEGEDSPPPPPELQGTQQLV